MDWEIERARTHCNKCSRQFVDQDKIFCALVQADNSFKRSDFCESCWSPEGQTSPAVGLLESDCFSFWQIEFAKKPTIDIQVVEQFFKNMTDQIDPKLKFLASLALIRKKRLKLLATKENLLVLEKQWDGEKIEVVDPQIKETELEPLKLELSKILGLPPESL